MGEKQFIEPNAHFPSLFNCILLYCPVLQFTPFSTCVLWSRQLCQTSRLRSSGCVRLLLRVCCRQSGGADKGCPLPFNYFILPQVPHISWQKRKTFCLLPCLRRVFNQLGVSDARVHIHYAYTIAGERKSLALFLKRQADHFERLCCTFPSTFWKGKSGSSESLSVCIINVFRVKEKRR